MKTLQWLLWQLLWQLCNSEYTSCVLRFSPLRSSNTPVMAVIRSSTAMVMASSHKEHNNYLLYARASRAKFTRSIITHSSWLIECLYYTYGSTANFLFLGPTALIYTVGIKKKFPSPVRTTGRVIPFRSRSVPV